MAEGAVYLSRQRVVVFISAISEEIGRVEERIRSRTLREWRRARGYLVDVGGIGQFYSSRADVRQTEAGREAEVLFKREIELLYIGIAVVMVEGLNADGPCSNTPRR